MQVQKIQSNYSTNFGAKLQTKGMEKFPQAVIEELTNLAKPIGKESDVIAIHLNGVKEETRVWSKKGRMNIGHYLRQNIDTASFINGELIPKRIEALVKSEQATPENVKSVREAIVNYFNTLKN